MEWSGVDTPQTVMTTRAPAVLINHIAWNTHKYMGTFYKKIYKIERKEKKEKVIVVTFFTTSFYNNKKSCPKSQNAKSYIKFKCASNYCKSDVFYVKIYQ